MSADREVGAGHTSDAGSRSASDAGSSSASDAEGYAGRETLRKRVLRSVAVQAAMVSAAVHFLWAWPRLADPVDARPYLFVLGGTFTVAVGVATLRAGEYRRLYALGAGTLFAFLAGYVGWHGTDALGVLASDPLAIVAKAAEIVGLLAFLGLYRLAPPTRVALERRDGADADGSEPDRPDSEGSEPDGPDSGGSGPEGNESNDDRGAGGHSA